MILRALFISLIFSFFSNAGLIKNSLDINVTGKPIMFIFTSQTCPYCKKLKKDLVEVESLNKIAKEFDIYEIMRDKPATYNIFGEKIPLQTLQMEFSVKVTPYVVIFSSKGEKLWQIPGYSEPSLLLKIMQFAKGVSVGKYKKEDWKKYLLENQLIKEKRTPH